MRLQAIRKLTFAYVRNPKLVSRATSWRFSEIEDEKVASPVRKSQSQYSVRFNERDLEGVEAMIALLNSLDDESLKTRLAEIEDQKAEQGKLWVDPLPISLSLPDLDVWAKNASWARYEAAFLANGFSIVDRCREKITDLLFPPQAYEVRFTLEYFPLFEAVLKLDNQLLSSSLFPKSHRMYFYDKSSALDIVNWFEKMEINLPNGLAGKVRYFQSDEKPQIVPIRPDQATEADPGGEGVRKQEINPKERESLLLLINGMAKAKFGFKPGGSLGPAIEKIDFAVRDTKASSSPKTIRKYLNKSEQALQNHLDRKK